MFWWLVLVPMPMIVFGVLAFVGQNWIVGVILALGALVGLVQAAIYGPRARRAARQERNKP
jgi:membrane associated rhomboid family serine protease